ncbi:MAG TPA: serine/threonine-protein kinase [Gemmatimonadaceae bacterium]
MTDLRDRLTQTLGDAYTLEQELGGGGMSRVFRARDNTLRRTVVVKVLPPELTAGVNIERFNREILLAARLQHPHIVPVHSAGDMDGLPWFTMPFIEGESLRARLGQGSLPVTETVGILRDVARALAYAHERGIVHRDIKPDNILLSGGSATVADFGIAKAISAARTGGDSETLTQVGTSIGTPAYMAPEQAAGDPETDHHADIYSFGCVAYEMLSGRPPFLETTQRKLMTAHMARAPQSIAELRPDAPAALANLVMRCLAKEATERPGHATDLVRALDSVTTGEGRQPAMPGILLGGPRMLLKALGVYALAFVAVAIIARAAIVGIGLPDWVFPGALIVMALGLPVILVTGYVQRVTQRAMETTPTYTPGGTPSLAQGTMATMALKASPHLSWRRTARGGVIAMAAFVVLVGGFMVLRALGIGPAASLFAAGSLEQDDRLVMADFTVNGLDSALGRVVSDAVRAGLSQSAVLTILSPTEISGALARMQRPRDADLDLETAREVAQRENAKGVVHGTVTQVGTSYIVSVSLVTADSGRELTSFRATAAAPDGIIDAADELARKLRAKSGESLRAVNAAPSLARVTTSSLAALKLYSAGQRANDAFDRVSAMRYLREAVAVDSTFAEAWRLLAQTLGNYGMPPSSIDSAITRAYALRDRLPDNARDRIVGTYYAGTGNDRAKAIEAYERMLARGDSFPLNNLGGLLGSRREFARAEVLMRASVKRGPSLLRLARLRSVLEAQGKWQATDSIRAEIEARFPMSLQVREDRLAKLEDSGDLEAWRRGVDSAMQVRNPENPTWAIGRAAELAEREGRGRDMNRLLREVWRVDSAVGRSTPSSTSSGIALLQRIQAGLPFDDELRAFEEHLERVPLSSHPPQDAPYLGAAGVLAGAGQVRRAREVLDQYRAAVTDSALLRRLQPRLDRVLGRIAVAEERWSDALRHFRAADSLPDGPAGSCDFCLPLDLLDVFAAAGMADSALAQYEAYRRTPWGSRPRVGPDLTIRALALEAVGKMYELRGDTAKAVEAYRDFVERWKNADPELQPRVSEARRRLEALTPVERIRR